MNIRIVKGHASYIDDCEEALVDSELGRQYFSEEGRARKALEDGFSQNDVYVALDDNGDCKGFAWVIVDGIFHVYPYVHILSVKRRNRGQGIGRKLLKHIEDVYLEQEGKLFLVVSDFNPGAKKLYKELGYVELADIPNLYKQGIAECLMMRAKD